MAPLFFGAPLDGKLAVLAAVLALGCLVSPVLAVGTQVHNTADVPSATACQGENRGKIKPVWAGEDATCLSWVEPGSTEAITSASQCPHGVALYDKSDVMRCYHHTIRMTDGQELGRKNTQDSAAADKYATTAIVMTKGYEEGDVLPAISGISIDTNVITCDATDSEHFVRNFIVSTTETFGTGGDTVTHVTTIRVVCATAANAHDDVYWFIEAPVANYTAAIAGDYAGDKPTSTEVLADSKIHVVIHPPSTLKASKDAAMVVVAWHQDLPSGLQFHCNTTGTNPSFHVTSRDNAKTATVTDDPVTVLFPGTLQKPQYTECTFHLNDEDTAAVSVGAAFDLLLYDQYGDWIEHTAIGLDADLTATNPKRFPESITFSPCDCDDHLSFKDATSFRYLNLRDMRNFRSACARKNVRNLCSQRGVHLPLITADADIMIRRYFDHRTRCVCEHKVGPRHGELVTIDWNQPKHGLVMGEVVKYRYDADYHNTIHAVRTDADAEGTHLTDAVTASVDDTTDGKETSFVGCTRKKDYLFWSSSTFPGVSYDAGGYGTTHISEYLLDNGIKAYVPADAPGLLRSDDNDSGLNMLDTTLVTVGVLFALSVGLKAYKALRAAQDI